MASKICMDKVATSLVVKHVRFYSIILNVKLILVSVQYILAANIASEMHTAPIAIQLDSFPPSCATFTSIRCRVSTGIMIMIGMYGL